MEQWEYSTTSIEQGSVLRMHMGRFVQVQVWALRGRVARGRGEVADMVEVETGGCGWVVEAVELLVPFGV